MVLGYYLNGNEGLVQTLKYAGNQHALTKVISESANLKINPIQTCFCLFSFILHDGGNQLEFFSAKALIFHLCSKSPATDARKLEHSLIEID